MRLGKARAVGVVEETVPRSVETEQERARPGSADVMAPEQRTAAPTPAAPPSWHRRGRRGRDEAAAAPLGK